MKTILLGVCFSLVAAIAAPHVVMAGPQAGRARATTPAPRPPDRADLAKDLVYACADELRDYVTLLRELTILLPDARLQAANAVEMTLSKRDQWLKRQGQKDAELATREAAVRQLRQTGGDTRLEVAFLCLESRMHAQLRGAVLRTGLAPTPGKAASPTSKPTGPTASRDPVDGNWKITLACPSLPTVDYAGRATGGKISTVSGSTAVLLTLSLDASGRLQVVGAIGRPALEPIRISASRNGAAYVGVGSWGKNRDCSFTATRTGQ